MEGISLLFPTYPTFPFGSFHLGPSDCRLQISFIRSKRGKTDSASNALHILETIYDEPSLARLISTFRHEGTYKELERI